MTQCPRCNTVNDPYARFCKRCGAQFVSEIRRGAHLWLRLDDVIHDPIRQLGAAGAFLAFIGGFLPWAGASVSMLGVEVGSYSTGAPQAMGLAILVVFACAILFHRRGGLGFMVVGCIIGLMVLLFALANASSSPALGLVVTAAGAGLMIYAGYRLMPGR